MKRFTFLLAGALLFSIGVNAQLRTAEVYCSDDLTLDKGMPDGNPDIYWGSNLCNKDRDDDNNSYQEGWIRWDLSSITLGEGEEILAADAWFRIGANVGGQGYYAIVLDSKYDTWSDEDFNWNKAIAIGDFQTEGGDTISIAKPALTDASQAHNLFSLKAQVSEELKIGNKMFTLRMASTITDPAAEKAWLGFYSLENDLWGDKIDPDKGINLDAPHLKLLIGKPAEQFSEDTVFGNANNYTYTPEGEWYGVKDETDNGRLLMMKNNSSVVDSLGAMAINSKKSDYVDFKLTMDARVSIAEDGSNVAIVFDYVDELNYKMFYFVLSQTIKSGVYTVVDGARTLVGTGTSSMPFTDAEYHTYTVERAGNVVTATVDGTEFLSVTDDAVKGTGSIGFGSGKYIVNFDNVYEGDAPLVSISSNVANVIMSVYPNPVNDAVTVSAGATIGTIRVVDVLGKELLNVKDINSDIYTVNMSDLKKGVYIIMAETSKGIVSSKIIKE